MKPEPGAAPGRRAQRHLLGALFASSLIVLIVTACGISLSAGQDETEIFKRLAVEGDFRPGGTLSLTLEYAQQYPVDVGVECALLEVDPEKTATPAVTNTPTNGLTPTAVTIPRARPTPKNKVLHILLETLPPNPEGGPVGEATPVAGTIQRDFPAPERPGRYVVWCFTPQDENNAIFERITVAPASTPSP